MAKVGRNERCPHSSSKSDRENPRCPRCGTELDYVSSPVFGDYALGISEEFWRCPNCGHREEVQYG